MVGDDADTAERQIKQYSHISICSVVVDILSIALSSSASSSISTD